MRSSASLAVSPLSIETSVQRKPPSSRATAVKMCGAERLVGILDRDRELLAEVVQLAAVRPFLVRVAPHVKLLRRAADEDRDRLAGELGLCGLDPLGLGGLGGCCRGRGGVLFRFQIGLGGVELIGQVFCFGGSLLQRVLRCGLGLVRFGLVRFGLVRFGLVRFGLVRFGLVRFGLVRFGLVRFGLVHLGLVALGLVRLDPIRIGQIGFGLIGLGLIGLGLIGFGLIGLGLIGLLIGVGLIRRCLVRHNLVHLGGVGAGGGEHLLGVGGPASARALRVVRLRTAAGAAAASRFAAASSGLRGGGSLGGIVRVAGQRLRRAPASRRSHPASARTAPDRRTRPAPCRVGEMITRIPIGALSNTFSAKSNGMRTQPCEAA